MKTLLLLPLLGAALASSDYKAYHGYKVLRTEVLDKASSDLLHKVMIEDNVDFWKEPAPGRMADLMVKGTQVDSVSKWLQEHNIKYSVMVENVQDLVDQSKKDMFASRQKIRSNNSLAMDWNDYQPLDVLNSFIQSLADANDFARIINIGQSYEGRDMNVLAVEKVLKSLLLKTTYHNLFFFRLGPELLMFGWRLVFTPESGSPPPWPPTLSTRL